jgi:hypothetical protein
MRQQLYDTTMSDEGVRISHRFSRLKTKLDNLPTVLRRDPFPFPPEVVRYVELNDLRHCRLLCPTRLPTSCDPAIPIHTDNEQNRKAVVFARALCRPHMNASTWSFPLICWTHRGRIATSHSCHVNVKNRVCRSHFSSIRLGGPIRITSITLVCRMVNLKGMSLQTGPDNLSAMAIFRQSSFSNCQPGLSDGDITADCQRTLSSSAAVPCR